MRSKIGYLLPTRERVMQGQPEAEPILSLAERAEALGYDSVWVGDSILARPRHEPLTMLAGVAGRTKNIELGTAVLLPALRNPILLAHLVATVDQICSGRLILGVGVAADAPSIRQEFESLGVPFEKRAGRMMEGLRLCRSLWQGQPVDWNGRWTVKEGTVGPTPFQIGGPPIWSGGSAPGSLKRAATELDGWFPTGPDAKKVAAQWSEIKAMAEAAGRKSEDLTFAVYLTMAIDENRERGEQQINDFLAAYYGPVAEMLKPSMACFAGPASEAKEWLQGYVDAGATHIVLRFASDHEKQLATVAKLRTNMA